MFTMNFGCSSSAQMALEDRIMTEEIRV